MKNVVAGDQATTGGPRSGRWTTAMDGRGMMLYEPSTPGIGGSTGGATLIRGQGAMSS